MSYATTQNLIDRFGEDEILQLTDRDVPPVGQVNETVAGQALADASDTIDGYLASRYTLPLSAAPTMLVRLCCDIARYLLMPRPTDEARKRYEDALAWLDKVAQGKYSLGVEEGAGAPAPSTVQTISTGNRTFTDCSLRDFTSQRPLGTEQLP